MTPSEKQIGGNILIAEATGWVYEINEETKDLYPMGYYKLGEDLDWCRPEELKFHEDFNWLANACLFLGYVSIPADINEAWNEIVATLKSQN